MDDMLCHGLWVPASDAKVFERYDAFEGLPNLDVSKVAECAALALTRHRAIDVGAHVGATTVYLARHFNQVDSFEAVPDTYRYLEKNVAGLANVTPHQKAVAAVPGEVYFAHHVRHGQLSHIAGSLSPDKFLRVGPIQAIPLDEMGFDDVSFVKIDVEGAEIDVVKGARETIRACKPLILIEQAGNEAKYFGSPLNEASQFLEDIGMTVHPQSPGRMSKDRLYHFAS
jgi:FkbM family methyltransferase